MGGHAASLTTGAVGDQTNYVGGTSSARHGSDQLGNLTSVTFREGELITSISGRARNMVYQVVLTTSLGRSFSIGGDFGGRNFTLQGPVFGFFGANAKYKGVYTLVGLGYWTDVSYLPPSPPPPVSPPTEHSGNMEQLHRSCPMFSRFFYSALLFQICCTKGSLKAPKSFRVPESSNTCAT